MTTPLRASKVRLIGGGVLALAGLLTAVFLLPDASQKQSRTRKALDSAATTLDQQVRSLKDAQAQADKVKAGRKSLDDLMANMPVEGVGRLHWRLSQKLFELAKARGVRLISVKYGPPTREGSRGSLLESVDVEFNATGLYQNLKAFMLDLEGSRLPFAVAGAKMEESPEGAHLTITLRAFRQTSAGPEAPGGEGA